MLYQNSTRYKNKLVIYSQKYLIDLSKISKKLKFLEKRGIDILKKDQKFYNYSKLN